MSKNVSKDNTITTQIFSKKKFEEANDIEDILVEIKPKFLEKFEEDEL